MFRAALASKLVRLKLRLKLFDAVRFLGELRLTGLPAFPLRLVRLLVLQYFALTFVDYL